jgi:hypothetical protein
MMAAGKEWRRRRGGESGCQGDKGRVVVRKGICNVYTNTLGVNDPNQWLPILFV